MSGHSKWSTIKRQKGANDAKRSSLFTKLSKDISTAVKIGGSGDIEFNSILKVAVDKAKASNMPHSNIQAAINRGLGISASGEVIATYSNSYEFMGPGGIALIVDTETDNPNRTITDLKQIARKYDVKIVPEGSISWQFLEVGYIEIETSENKEEVELNLMEIEGIKDLEAIEQSGITCFKIIVEKEKTRIVNDEIKKLIANANVKTVEIIKKSENLVNEIEEKAEEQLINLIDDLEQNEDVVNIWHNYKE